MSFSRAFSTRRKSPDIQISTPIHIGRAASNRGGKPVIRAQISSPMALISTSNSRIHDAQVIGGAAPIEVRNIETRNFSSSTSNSSSSEDSDTCGSSVHSKGTVTDASSIDESPVATEPEPNHLSCYFKPTVDTHSRTTSHTINHSPSLSMSSRPSMDTPRIPQRVPSHSKKAHEQVHRKRSIQRMLSPPPSRDGPREARSSTEIFEGLRSPRSPKAFVEAPKENSNPFGQEIAQLDIVAEEFGQVVRTAEADADAVYLESHGLAHYSASEYMSEIQSLIHAMFADEQPAMPDIGNFF